jgi:diguanylate cyclase (GGDEF)-like protein/PAS domain S-box-containing protein
MPLTGALTAEHCLMPAGGCASILGEHADAIRLIQRMRDASRQSEHGAVRHWFKPFGEVSADFFCTAEHPRFGWYALMADVSGHGLVSSMFALHVPLLFRESVLLGMSLPAIYARIDEFLARQQIGGYFVSGFLIRVQEREIEVINAGMPDALLLTADGRLCEAFTSRQLPFGIAGQAESQVAVPQRYRLAREESASLLLYSDGLSELGVLGGDAFGREGILAKAVEGADRVFENLLDKVRQSADEIHDDISIALVPVPLRKPNFSSIESDAAEGVETADPFLQTRDISTILRIVENLDQGLMLTDAEQRILYVNPAFTAITAYLPDEIIGQTPRLLSSGRHDAAFYHAMWQALHDEGNWFGEMWNRRKDGTLYLQWIDIQAIRDEEGRLTNYLATFTDILRKREQEDRLRFLALHDSLTGLANRILLTDRGRQAIYRADRAERSLAILFIDLDRFKSINDSLGHDIGDEVLVEVAQRLRRAVRSEDTLARFGGDQFICLLPDIDSRHDALRVANKLLAALAVPVIVAGHQFKVGASIGVSAYPSDGAFFDDLIVRADRAMVRAKRAGGNLVKFFAAEMAAEMDRQLEMEARLDAALAAGELVLYYQPKVDLLTHAIIGAEALVRWHDPQHGVVSPGVFIPVAERSELIAKIGQWVLREAC